MILITFIVLLYICFSGEKIIKNGVYNFIANKFYLYSLKGKIYLSANFKHPNTFFRIKRIYSNKNDTFFNIEEIYNNYKLGYLKNNEIAFISNNNNSQVWKFIVLSQKYYIIKNNNDCFLIIINFKIFCQNISFNQATKFELIKIYSEIDIKTNKYNSELINKEPIDILIKYIDLRDPKLKRDNIHQIEKDYDNEELRYSVRSILNNIPWVRKIFILMPNEKVRYFKDYNLINDKIIYVKDKDLLGYDSSNSLAFQFRYWKMKKFGISDNIIVMDDDCFIGSKLEKTDFFYVKHGKVVPLIITSNFIKINKSDIENSCRLYEVKAKSSKKEQNNAIFNYSKYLTILFILNLFNYSLNEDVFIPKFTHNAIPVNLDDVKELYNFIYNSKFKYSTLDCQYRHIESLQFQILIISYTFIKYNKKVKDIPYQFIVLENSDSTNYNSALFCINKNSGKYSHLNLYKAKIVMEYLFPFPSPYEILDYSIINISFLVISSMSTSIKNFKKNKTKYEWYQHFYYLELFFLLIIILIWIVKLTIIYT